MRARKKWGLAMKVAEKIINQFGGMEAFWESRSIRVNFDPFRSLLIQIADGSPNGLPAISMTQECRDNGITRAEIQMIFELCDLGWFPYYYKNVFDVFEGVVYKQDAEGRILSVRHNMKRKLLEIALEWDAQLEELEYTTLSGNQYAANLFPLPFFMTLSPAP
ncbi:MAG: hypothetical protein K8S54_17735 [Spirochaetia bacterium]|nr:hypothetical protein [Spirochaetia bacterium]